MDTEKFADILSRSWPFRYGSLIGGFASSVLIAFRFTETAGEIIPDWVGFAHYATKYVVFVWGLEKGRRYFRNFSNRRASLAWRRKDARDFAVLNALLITLWLPWRFGAPVGVALSAVCYYWEVYRAEVELNRKPG